MSETNPSPSSDLPISFACIAHNSEAHQVMEMIATLPSGCELVVLWNEQGDNPEVVERKVVTLKNGTVVRYYATQWQELHFANLRNLCIGLCNRDWVMWLDSDDRLLPYQHKYYSELSSYPAGVGGLVCGCVGNQPTHEGTNVMRYNTAQVRLFRNHKGFAFEGATHEQLGWSIESQAYRIESCSLLIHHVGYEIAADAMIGKLERNIQGLAKTFSECDDAGKKMYWLEVMHRDCGSLLHYVKKGQQ